MSLEELKTKLRRYVETKATVWDFSGGVNAQQARVIADALQADATVVELKLRGLLFSFIGNDMGPEGAKAVAEALRHNATLHTVDLSSNDMGPEGAKAVAEALRHNATLHTVNLSGNRIGPEGAKAVAKALRHNATLYTMNLSLNDMGPEGAKAVAKALWHNTTLHTVNLMGNSMGPEGAKAVAEALWHNTTLHTVNLMGTDMGPEGAKAVAVALRHNTALQKLFLGADIDNMIKEDIEELLGRNRRLAEKALADPPPPHRLPANSSPPHPRVPETAPANPPQPHPRVPETAPADPPPAAAESVLALHRLLRRAVGQRRRAAGEAGGVPAGFEALGRALRAVAAAVEGDGATQREAEVASVQQQLSEALDGLAAAQLAVRRAASTLPAAVSDDAIEAELREVTVRRDKSRADTCRALTDAATALLRVACDGQGGADVEIVMWRAAELQRWIGEVEAALAPCLQRLASEEGERWGRDSAAPEAGRLVTLPEALQAYDAWQAECSVAVRTHATDEALAAVTAALAQTRLLTPPADDLEEEAVRLAAVMQAADAALQMEIAAWGTWDPAARFPARLLTEGARQRIEGWQAEVRFLQVVEQRNAEWTTQAANLRTAMDNVVRKAEVVQRWQTAHTQLKRDRLMAEILDKQHELARVANPVTPELGTQQAERAAAQQAVGEARAALRAATAGLVEAAADYPELVCYVGRGLPEPLLPLWESDRRVEDFEEVHLVPGPSRNRVYRGTLAGQRFVLKGFPLPAGGAHTCLREAQRLVRAAHPHVVEVVALFQDPITHTFYLQMPDYTEGHIDRWATRHNPDVPAMRRALRQAFDGVAHLHCLGIIHSDLKPANLLVAANGTVRVGDLDVSVDCATRVSPQYASTVLVGYTAGFAAPELLRTGATKASDAYSLGAVVRELGVGVASAAGPDAADLVRRLCADDPAARPTVVAALQHAFFVPAVAWEREQRLNCGVFASELCGYGETPVALARGVQCVGVGGTERHFVCDECLTQHVTTFLDSELRVLRATECRIRCPQCPANGGEGGVGAPGPAYPDGTLAQHLPEDVFGRYIGRRLWVTEQQLAEQFDADVRAAVEAERQLLQRMDERQRRVRQARLHVVEEILNLRCPRCRQVFVDFDGCCALSCSRCPCNFCAWCGRDCGSDAHAHTANCGEKPAGAADVFARKEVWQEQQRRRRRRLAEAYLATLDAETRAAVRQQLRQDLEGL